MKGFVYLAGQYQKPGGTHGYSDYFDIDANINTARKWAAKFARARISFFCPHLNSAHFEVIAPDVPAAFWYDMDLELLIASQAVFLMPGWEKSKGAQEENQFAINRSIPVFQDFPTLERWWIKR